MVDEVEEQPMTPEEMEMLKSMGVGYPQEEEKQNIFSFFKRVIAMQDSSRTANLTAEEIGMAHTPVRTYQQLALFCSAMRSEGLAKYFQQNSQIILGTSLSRDGFLDRLAVTQKREVESKRRGMIQNKGWFKPKQQEVVT